MARYQVLLGFLAISVSAFAQGKKSAVICDSTQIVSVANLATGDDALSPGALAKVLWCDFEFPQSATPVASISVHGQPAFVAMASRGQATPVTSVVLRGYPSFRPQEFIVQLPGDLDTGGTDLTVQTASASASKDINIDSVSPGIFTLDQQPKGPAIAQNDNGYILGDNAAQVGSTITIYATGLGATTPFVPAGQVPSGPADTVETPEVRIGDQQAVVVSSRLSPFTGFPSAAGIYEVTVVVPPVDTSQQSQKIHLRIGGRRSNVATLPVIP